MFTDFLFYIEFVFIEQKIESNKQTIYNNGFSDLTDLNLLFEPQNSGDNLDYVPEINLSSLFQKEYESNINQSHISNRLEHLNKIHDIRKILQISFRSCTEVFKLFADNQ